MSKTEAKAYEVSSRSSAAAGLSRSGYNAPGEAGMLVGELGKLTLDDRKLLLREILRQRIHGISCSPYIDGQ